MWKLASPLDQMAIPGPGMPVAEAANPLLLRRASEWMLAHWRRAKGDQAMPLSSALDALFATQFGPCCVSGALSLTESPRVARMGERFTAALQGKDLDRADAFAAATTLGMLVSLADELQMDPRPVQQSGEFLIEGKRTARYHAVAMPFRGDFSSPPAWLGAAEWQIQPVGASAARLVS